MNPSQRIIVRAVVGPLLLTVSALAQAPPPPTIAKAFTSATIGVNGISTLTVTVTNPSATPLTGVAFSDTLPAGLIFATPSGLASNCGGVAVAAAGPPSVLALSGGTLAGNGSCVVSANVTSATAGTYVNTTGAVTSTESGPGLTATATLVVLALPTLTKSFAPSTIQVGAPSTLTLTITNPNNAPLSGLAFADILPLGLIFATPSGVTSNCGGVTVAAPGPPPTLILSGGSLGALSSCTVTVNVTSLALGTYSNVAVVSSTQTGPGLPNEVAVLVVLGTIAERYAANLNIADSLVNITNTGAFGASLTGPGFGPVGNICVNLYSFSPDEQLTSCCSCLLTPNGLVSLSVYDSLRSNTLTGVTPNSMVIKIITTLSGPTGTGTTCAGSPAVAGLGGFPIVNGGSAAWGTTAHIPGAGAVPGAPAPFAITETPFTLSTLSPAELASINNRCLNIMGNGSGFGICRGCQAGGRGAASQ